METVIKVGEYEIPAKSTAASLISYKANFGRDGVRDLLSLAKSFSTVALPEEGEEVTMDAVSAEFLESFDLDLFFRFLWVFAKAKEPDIPPMERWLERFDMPPMDFAMAALPQVVELLGSTVKSSVKAKK